MVRLSREGVTGDHHFSSVTAEAPLILRRRLLIRLRRSARAQIPCARAPTLSVYSILIPRNGRQGAFRPPPDPRAGCWGARDRTSRMVFPPGRAPRGRHTIRPGTRAISSDSASACWRPGLQRRYAYEVSRGFPARSQGTPGPRYPLLRAACSPQTANNATSCHRATRAGRPGSFR